MGGRGYATFQRTPLATSGIPTEDNQLANRHRAQPLLLLALQRFAQAERNVDQRAIHEPVFVDGFGERN